MKFPEGRRKENRFLRRIPDTYGIEKIPRDTYTTMLDIGANIGTISMIARFFHPIMRIIAFEPCLTTYECLVANTAGMFIETVNTALLDGSDVAINLGRCGSVGNSVSTVPEGITSRTLTEIVAEFGINPAETILKIDCEGGEHSLLTNPGDYQLFGKFGYIAMEVHKRGDKTAASFVDHFTANHRRRVTEVNFGNNGHILSYIRR